MHLEADRDALVECSQAVLRVVSPRATHPVLGGVRITAKDGTVELAATDLELFVAVTEEFSARRRAGSGHPGARRVPHGLQHPQQAGAVPPPRSASHGLSRSRSRDATTPLGGGLLARLRPTMFSERLRAISREARCWRHRRSRGVTVPKERSDAGFAERRAR